MPFVADVHADVVQQRAVFEPLALAIAQPVIRAGAVEQRQCEPRDLLRVVGQVVATLAQLHHAAPPDVRVAIDLADVRLVLLDVVEQESFAQREVAECDVLGAEGVEERVDEHGAGDGQIGAPWIEAGHGKPVFQRLTHQRLPEPPQIARAHAEVADVGRPMRAGGQGPQREDRARRADDPLEPAPDDLPEKLPGFTADVADQPPFIAPGQGIAAGEPLGQADRAQLEAAPGLHARGRAERDLRAATADVDDDRGAGTSAGGIQCRLVNQPCFFHAGNDADADADVPQHRGDELGAVGCFADGARRRGDDLVHGVRLGETPELRERLHRDRDARLRQPASFETASAEPNHVLLAVDHLEGQIRADPTDDHVNRIGADVDGRDAHALPWVVAGVRR